MSDGALHLAALVAATLGMIAFALSIDAHWRQLLGDRPQPGRTRLVCKSAGAALLGLSLLFCALADPFSMALLLWPMMLGIAAAIVASLLAAHGRSTAGPAKRLRSN